MNDMEKFLNFDAVIKVRRNYDDELYKFIELIKSVGFLKEYIDSFEKNCCTDKKFNEFSEDVFWHYVEINKGNKSDTCIEFQWYKGFTWGNGKEYKNYDSEMKILTVDELIKACNKEELFNMNYENSSFKDELENKESATDLDNFLDFYEWSLTKYPDGKFNIKDEQCNTFKFEENTTLNEVIDIVYFRMVDYFMVEEDIDGLIEENNFDYVKKVYESYIKTGKSLNLLDEEKLKQYENWFEEIKPKNSPKQTIEEIEIDNDI
jgi:hypothetical protein